MTIVVGDARLGNPSGPLAPVTDPVIGLRRWIARTIAARLLGADLSSLTADAALAQLGSDLSADGRIALTALLREARLPFDYRRQVPGFVGPDCWYA
jgi:hypothetical protein